MNTLLIENLPYYRMGIVAFLRGEFTIKYFFDLMSLQIDNFSKDIEHANEMYLELEHALKILQLYSA
jgi:hypothetical protein